MSSKGEAALSHNGAEVSLVRDLCRRALAERSDLGIEILGPERDHALRVRVTVPGRPRPTLVTVRIVSDLS